MFGMIAMNLSCFITWPHIIHPRSDSTELAEEFQLAPRLNGIAQHVAWKHINKPLN